MSVGNRHGMPAHRYAYEQAKGPIPDGMVVMHTCDNRKCVNPEHLIVGTQSDNMRDCVAKGRRQDQNGEKGPSAKLKEQDVHFIRASTLTNTELGKRFNVSGRTISDARRGKTWRHI